MTQVVKRRASAFASLRNAECLGPAKISALFPLTNGCFGLAVVDSELILVKGLSSTTSNLSRVITLLTFVPLHQCLQCTRSGLEKGQTTHGHRLLCPLGRCPTSLCSATSTLANANSNLWSAWPPGPCTSPISLPSRFSALCRRIQFDNQFQLGL
jgi:hypothetical protein